MKAAYISIFISLLFEVQRASCTTVPPPNAINNSSTETTTPKIAYNNTVGTRPTGNDAGNCEDKWFGLCPILAGNGYCSSNCLLGSWTEAGCKKSCGKCKSLQSSGRPSKEDTLALNSNVDIAFMMDATASMGANIARAKANIAEIVKNVKNAFKDNVIRMGFVAYRDYTEGSGRIETFDFTDDIVKFTENLGKIKAERGADYPEDVLGGINATLGLSWQAANKLFFQIGDAPPRGFCGFVGQVWDTYKRCTAITEDDKNGPQAPELFEKIDQNCLIYNVLQTDDFQDDMVAKFATIAKPHGGENRFKVYDMKSKGLDFTGVSTAIVKSIGDQLKATNDYLNNPNAPRNRCILTK